MPYLKISHDCTKSPFELVSIPDESYEWLHTVYELIGCDCIEIANTMIGDLVLVLDESGKCFDDWEFRVNIIATQLYGHPYDPIVGDVILARREGPDLIPLTDKDIERIERLFKTDIRH